MRGLAPGAARRPGLFGYFVRHGTAANLLLALMLLAGLAATQALRVQLYPDVVVNAVKVTVTWRGAGPEQLDDAVVQLLEPALQEVDGVSRIVSIARDRRAVITLEFEPGHDMTAGSEAVNSAVASVTGLPDAAETPRIERVAWRDRVTDVVIHGPVGHEQTARLADEFADRMRRAGVSRIVVRGAPPPVIRVEAPEAMLMRHDLSLAEISRAVGDAARTDPSGQSDGARVSTGQERRTVEEVGAVILRYGPDGQALRVRDVAHVEDAGEKLGARYYVDGQAAAVVRVERGEYGDTLGVLDTAKRVAAEMAPTLPRGVEIELVHTMGNMIKERLALLMDNAALGLALVLGVLFLFLSARTALWVAAGIPAALLAAAAAMWALGMTVNMVSVFALIITLGIVVDDAIVVGEHADALARRGLSPRRAAETAARRMAAPVGAAALTTMIAFAAVLAIGGKFGTVIADIPLVVCIVLAASLVECFLILPNHMSHALTGLERRRWYDAPSRFVNRGFDAFRDRAFRPLMKGVVRLRWPMLGLALMLLALSVEALVSREVQWRFWNAPEQNSIYGNAAMLAGATREDTLEQMAMMEAVVRETAADYEAEHGENPVRFILSQVGGGAGRGLAVQDSKEAWQLGSVSVEMIDAERRDYTSFEFLADVQKRLRRHPMAEIATFRGQRGGPGGDAISIRLSGAEPEALKAASEEVKAALAVFPEVSALEDTLAYDKTELVLELTPLGEALGLTTEALGAELHSRLAGIEAAEFPSEGRAARILVQLPEAEDTADFLFRTRIRLPSGAWAPLAELADITARPGFSSLRREDGIMSIGVSGDLDMDDAEAAAAVETALADRILPQAAARHAVNWELSGLKEEERAFLGDAEIGFWGAIAGIYLVLAWVFASFARPLAVLLVVPFGLVGAVWGHWAFGVPMSMFSIVGLIGMTGIIINDSIVLISTIDEYARTRGLRPAIIDAVCDRLRPVMLTTLTTVLGLAPMLFETSQQAQFLKPTVITLCFGLGFGFFLVLMVTPALVMAQRDVGAALVSARRLVRLALRKRRRPRARPAE